MQPSDSPKNKTRQTLLSLIGKVFFSFSPNSPVEAVGTEAMSTLGLKRSSQYIMAAVAQVFVLQLIAQDLLGEAGFIALHGGGRGRFLCGHGVCSHVTPGKEARNPTLQPFRSEDERNDSSLVQQLEKHRVIK